MTLRAIEGQTWGAGCAVDEPAIIDCESDDRGCLDRPSLLEPELLCYVVLRGNEDWRLNAQQESSWQMLTFVLFRRPLEPSIQIYSARTWPRWSNFMYLATIDGSLAKGRNNEKAAN